MSTTPLNADAARARFGPTLEARLSAAVGGDSLMEQAARYHLSTGGKRLRALIPPWLAANLGANEAQLEDALRVGIALELMHNGTLVHDDLQDGDTHRRGLETVWVRYGMPQAVNVGSAMLLWGLAKVLETGVRAELIADMNLSILAVIGGQALEFELHVDPSPTQAKWNRMATGKTGALFGACLLGGARSAGLDEDACEDAIRFGEALGLFFQIQDDLLDLVGDKGRDVPATDLAEGKISWPVAWACEHAEPHHREALMAIVRAPREATSLAMIQEGLALLHESGAIAACITETERQAQALLASPWAKCMPGLVEAIVAPIAHVFKGQGPG